MPKNDPAWFGEPQSIIGSTAKVSAILLLSEGIIHMNDGRKFLYGPGILRAGGSLIHVTPRHCTRRARAH